MKKLIMVLAATVGMIVFGAANDPLIQVNVETGATYDVLCKGEKLFSFVSDQTGTINVQGVGAKSMNVADYQINLLSAVPEEGVGDGTGTANGIVLEDFETPGTDCYADGVRVLEGEVYALVWMKKDATFKGFAIDKDKGIVCVDEANNWFTRVYGLADGSGKCVRGEGVTLNPPTGWEDGHFAVFAFDTRKPGMNDLAEKVNGLPTFLKGYREVVSGEAVTTAGWMALKIGTEGLTFAFDPSGVLENGLAAVSIGDGKWMVLKTPTAYHTVIENKTVSSQDGLTILCKPEDVNTKVTLTDPFTLETTHQFLAFTDDIKKVVEAISPLMPKDKFGCADFKNMQAVNDAATQAYLSGAVTLDEVNAAAAFLAKVSPFWSWNCDFEVSFNRPIEKGSYVLAGYYKQASNFGFEGWVCSAYEQDLPAGKSIRLLKDNNYSGVYVTYYEICSRVQEFLCGAKNLSPDNYGTTITVKLNIYDNAHDIKATVDTYDYTFKGPLNVVFREGLGCETVQGEIVLPEAICIETDGKDEIQLKNPTYSGADNTGVVFVGWSNTVEKTIWTKIPARTWADADHAIELCAVFKPAKPVTVTSTTSEGATVETTLKVTEEWLEEQGIEKDDAESAMNAEDPNGYKKWQNYVIGNTNKTAHLEVIRTEGETEEKAVVISNMTVPPPDSGFKVTYSLDKIDATEKETVKAGAEQETSDVKIELQREDGDTPTGYYKMNIFIRPDDQPEAEVEPIKAVETVGVLKLESNEPVVPVAVPWNSLENGEAIKTTDIVKPSTLTEGDLLHVYDKEKGAYINLEIKNGAWEQIGAMKIDALGNVTVETIDDIDLSKASRGSSVFLERKTLTEKPVYLLGQYKKGEEAKVEISAPDTDKGETQSANLIAPTSIEPTDLNKVIVPEKITEGSIGENDQLMLVRDGLPSYYKFKDGKWGYYKSIYNYVNGKLHMTQKWVDDDVLVPAGVGFWYLSKGGTPTIIWPSDAKDEVQGE